MKRWFSKMIAIVKCAHTETIKFLKHLSSIFYFLLEWHHVRWREKPTNLINRCYCGNHLCYTHLNKLIVTLTSRTQFAISASFKLHPKIDGTAITIYIKNFYYYFDSLFFLFSLWALGATRNVNFVFSHHCSSESVYIRVRRFGHVHVWGWVFWPKHFRVANVKEKQRNKTIMTI